ncbi:MAG: Dak phosphatase, partial [Marmoricola sp.]|nr:Dak phosphatase [Marmoricola sp.]
RAAADAGGRAAADPSLRLGAVVHAAHQAALEALALTPTQLERLAQAGVVDAGGRGLCVVLEALESAVTGLRPTTHDRQVGRPALPVVLPTGDLTESGPAYEVMYLLEATDEAVETLRAELDPLGDSLVVVGGEGLWNVHVHVDDVGAAVEAGIRAGRPRRIAVTHFAEQDARHRERRAPDHARALVMVAAGPGLVDLYRSAGAEVVEGGPGRRPSTGDLVRAIEATGCAEVLLLPNDDDTLGVARAAAHEAGTRGVHVVVIPTRAQVQGIAALAVHEPGRPLDDDVVTMTAAARGARHGAVTIAAKEAMTSAGPCAPGDALGVVGGDFVIVGRDLFEVSCGVLERLLGGGGGELVTLVVGRDAGDLAQACEHWVGRAHPGVDVVVHEGGQDRYPLLVAVE